MRSKTLHSICEGLWQQLPVRSARLHNLRLASQSSSFSTTATLEKKAARVKPDPRITNIRYHLWHPKNPRPLRFSRMRHLRHWTIHRAWHLFRANQRRDHELSLERQYMSMRDACEALRHIGEDGLAIEQTGKSVPPIGVRDIKALSIHVPDVSGGQEKKEVGIDVTAAAQAQQEVGRLYRIAMEKKGVWNGVPIEYARAQTDTPSRSGWNHTWKR